MKNRATTIDRTDVVNVIAARARDRAGAERVADRVTQAAQDVQQTVQERAPEVANKVASVSSTAIWLALLGMGLTLGAAVFGTQRTAAE